MVQRSFRSLMIFWMFLCLRSPTGNPNRSSCATPSRKRLARLGIYPYTLYVIEDGCFAFHMHVHMRLALRTGVPAVLFLQGETDHYNDGSRDERKKLNAIVSSSAIGFALKSPLRRIP